ncbi:MAG: alpha amylase catalytic region [Actinomycetia bacterium]|nr:alpha amylase catalytic region [Actinomycetes bacterium]
MPLRVGAAGQCRCSGLVSLGRNVFRVIEEFVLRVPNRPEQVEINRVSPDVDGGRYAVKRVVGDPVVVEADAFTYGHDEIAVRLDYRRHGRGKTRWQSVWMEPLGNDRWRGEFTVDRVGEFRFRVVAWRDPIATWRRDIVAKLDAGQDVDLEREEGAQLAEGAAKRVGPDDGKLLLTWANRLRTKFDEATRADLEQLVAYDRSLLDPDDGNVFEQTSTIWVDRPLAGCSAWYELFPRSASPDARRSGTLADVADRIETIAAMGFDVVYLPPIHPIGVTHRKGANNRTQAQPGDPGSPWAIGGADGGHTAIHPGLGTLADFDRLVAAANGYGVEIALDLAFQASPDHPWIREHPRWFRHRPDGSLAFAENPPKKYEDIVPFDFDSEDRAGLWSALLDVVRFWIDHGVRVFRVDNPHTKPFLFWEWLIAQVRAKQPDVVFLAEAFTRPRVMEQLAKIGFTESYTYFTWRNTKHELIEYFTELTTPPLSDYFRPNVWPNTPDILHETLQHGSRGTFIARAVLAAGLSAHYGIYGPVFELQERAAREPGSEEYLDSEKYQIRHWDNDRPDSLRHFLARLNEIRRAHPALQRNDSLRFHDIDNGQLLCWSKSWGSDHVLVVVNLDPESVQSGWTSLDLSRLGVGWDDDYVVRDLLTGASYDWRGPHNFVRLDPASVPAHVFAVERVNAGSG